MNVVTYVVKGFLFKNAVLVVSVVVGEFMLYEGDYYYLGS